MNPPSIDIKDFFVVHQIGYFLGDSPQNPHNLDWAISVSYEPDNPNLMITIYDTGAEMMSKTFSGSQNEGESVQIRIRSLDYSTGYAKIREIRDYLNSKGKTYISGENYRYENFVQITGILPLDKDERKRFLFTVNYTALRLTG